MFPLILPDRPRTLGRHLTVFSGSLAICGLACAALVAAEPSEGHWAFRAFANSPLPVVANADALHTAVDHFIAQRLATQQLPWPPRATRRELIRRWTLNMTGVPPSPEDVVNFIGDDREDASERLIDRLLASPRYGERWGKYWLDVVGYADSNGYFNADTDRPLAYHFRDYVIRSWNSDKPFDVLVREQLAGDELANLPAAGAGATVEIPDDAAPSVERIRELLTATHFLRNAQDGTGESDGNPDEQTVDRATPLEGCLQITMNSLLAINIQCARCHEHKFEPIGHDEYYRLQSVFYPVFPVFHPDRWVKPQSRINFVASVSELREWESQRQRIDEQLVRLRQEYHRWWHDHRPAGLIRFADNFDDPQATVAAHWSNSVPGDDAPAGVPAVGLDRQTAPGSYVRNGALVILESGAAGDRWLATQQRFDWTPERQGEWIQVTFDLVDNKAEPSGRPAERVAFVLALHDFNDNSSVAEGNLLIDGNPAGAAAVYLDYPGEDAHSPGKIGAAPYIPGRNYGVRITRLGDDQYQLEQLVDGMVDGGGLKLKAADLPDGAFGFEYCCGRSFVVDNVVIEGAAADQFAQFEAFSRELADRKKSLDQAVQTLESQKGERPGKIAAAGNLLHPAPESFVLARGDYKAPTSKAPPAGLRALSTGEGLFGLSTTDRSNSDGRRTAFANWLTQPDSRASALLARVIANRIWRGNFEVGLVANAANFGVSGQPPSHPELLERLAHDLVLGGWQIKALQRQILMSAVNQQSSVTGDEAWAQGQRVDPANQLLWRYPAHRLDSDALRDEMLFVSGELDLRMFGPYVSTERQGDGNVVVSEQNPGARRRAIYLQQRRSQVETLLEVFDSPSILTTCPQRATSTVPLQSLAMLNSDWVRNRAHAFANRMMALAHDDRERIRLAFALSTAKEPSPDDWEAALLFLDRQRRIRAPADEPQVWTDFCQMMLSSSYCSYLD